MFLIFRDLNSLPPQQVLLEADEIRHLRARRLAPGAAAALGDGRGKRWSGELAPDQKSILLQDPGQPLEKKEGRRILCPALPAGNRWDWLVQKAVELGVTDIFPLIFRHSERREFSLSRGRRIVREAAAQAQRFTLPQLAGPLRLTQIEGALPPDAQPLVFHRVGPVGSGALPLGGEVHPAPPVDTAIIGPEGGFTTDELTFFQERGWGLVALGETVLRVETASLAALAFFLIQSGEFRITTTGRQAV